MFQVLKKSLVLVPVIFLMNCSEPPEELMGDEPEPGLGVFHKDVVLKIQASQEEDWVQSTFSFYHLTRDDEERTQGSWDLLARQVDGEDRWVTNLVHGDFGQLADMGPISCKEIQLLPPRGPAESQEDEGDWPRAEDRQNDPGFWFDHSEADLALANSKQSEMVIKNGHCYALFKLSPLTKVKALFRVMDYRPGDEVTLGEIEVFARARFQ